MPIVTRAVVVDLKVRDEITREYILKPDKFVNYEAGQFLQLALEHVTASDYWPESRTFSIASYGAKDKTLRLIIKKVGEYTAQIFEKLQLGESCTIKYAYGDFVLPQFDDENEIVCVAGGTGITPFLSFVDALDACNQLNRLKILYSVKKMEDIVDYEKLSTKLESKKLIIFSTREQNSGAINRHIELQDIVDCQAECQKKHFYICGSKAFIQHYQMLLKEKGISRIYVDEWE